MKSSRKQEAKDVKEPVKSLVTAVTTAASAIKRGALTALKSTWGTCHCACLLLVHKRAGHTHTHTGSLSITEGEGVVPGPPALACIPRGCSALAPALPPPTTMYLSINALLLVLPSS